MCEIYHNEDSGQTLERIFKENLFLKSDQDTAAYYHIQFRNSDDKNKLNVLFESSINPDVIHKIIDYDKVWRMRNKRCYPFPVVEKLIEPSAGDAYQIKPRDNKIDEEKTRKKILTKKKPENDYRRSEIVVDNLDKLSKAYGNASKEKKKKKKKKSKGTKSKTDKSSVTSNKSKDGSKKVKPKKDSKKVKKEQKENTVKTNVKDTDKIAKQKKTKEKSIKILEKKSINRKQKSENESKRKEKVTVIKKKRLSENVKNTSKFREIKEDKNKLPAFARGGAQLKEIHPNNDWNAPWRRKKERPRYHGIHMQTKCFKNIQEPQESCEKTSVFSRYIKDAENLNGGPLTKHVYNREHLYDRMCQDLMTLEKDQEKHPNIYKQKSQNCYQCCNNVNQAESVFFKTSHEDETRNIVRLSKH